MDSLERRATEVIFRYRAVNLALIFAIAEVAHARSMHSEAMLEQAKANVRRLKDEMALLQRDLMRIRAKLHQRRLREQGMTAENFGPVPDHMPEEL